MDPDELNAANLSIFDDEFIDTRVGDDRCAMLDSRESVLEHESLGKFHLSVKVNCRAEQAFAD